MQEIIRGTGFTETEKYLARLAEHTFLNLWSYPNVHRDEIVNGQRAGREICDLLVVCGEHVIIFSDKDIGWTGRDIQQSWSRWYRKAVIEGSQQLYGAEKWIRNNPNRIFTDVRCEQPLPVGIPASPIIHLVLVTHGAEQACSDSFDGDSGSFMIAPTEQEMRGAVPFIIGDVDPSRTFIHILNNANLDIVMLEFDTITDFTNYLAEKTSLVRSGRLVTAAGEEELVAYYLTHMVSKDRHGFPHPKNRAWEASDRLALSSGHYKSMSLNPQYLAKKEADKISYLWDHLIEVFTKYLLKGTTIVPQGERFDLKQHALGVRYMAQEPRVMRRMLGGCIDGMMKKSHLQDKTFGCMLPANDHPDETGYVFLTLAHLKSHFVGGYEQYRQTRSSMLSAYCLCILKKNPFLKRIVGIASEPVPQSGELRTTSEDMALVRQPEQWTDDLENELNRLQTHHDIFREDRTTFQHVGVQEYPSES